jgi:hypothetical protein
VNDGMRFFAGDSPVNTIVLPRTLGGWDAVTGPRLEKVINSRSRGVGSVRVRVDSVIEVHALPALPSSFIQLDSIVRRLHSPAVCPGRISLTSGGR